METSNLIGYGTASTVLLGIFIWFLRDSARQDQRVDASYVREVRGLVNQLDETRADRDRAYERLDKCQMINVDLHAENTRLLIENATLWRRLGLDPADGLGASFPNDPLPPLEPGPDPGT
jgi:uncharacterized membrane protein YccC